MKIRVQSVHFNADQKLLEFIQKKADKTDTFFDRIIDGEVILKLEKSTDERNKVLWRLCVSLDYSCRMWTTAKTDEWRKRWQADIEAKRALLRNMLGGATDANT